jgi:peptide/nickel transport system permease protein
MSTGTGSYLVRRLAHLIPTVLGLVVVVFLVVRLTPGDPAISALGENPRAEAVEQLRDTMNLDEPIPVALFDYIWSLARGDLGTSIVQHTTVSELIGEVLPVTMAMAVGALVTATVLGIGLGAAAAYLSSRGRHMLDHGVTSFAILLEATPHFVLGLVGLLVFVLHLGWFPATGVVDLGNVGEAFQRLALPVAILAVGTIATIGRVTRTSILDVLNEDYVRTARALGESPLSALNRHALRNALIPVITMIGLNFGRLLGGTVVMEVVFSLPGMGTTLVDAIVARDYPVVQGLVLVYAVLYVVVNLATDLLYRRVDPRVVL